MLDKGKDFVFSSVGIFSWSNQKYESINIVSSINNPIRKCRLPAQIFGAYSSYLCDTKKRKRNADEKVTKNIAARQ